MRRNRLTRAALLGALVVTLVAGLYPFSWARRNDVSWRRDGCGLLFGPASMAVSETRLAWDTSGGPGSLCFELWLAPAGPTGDATPFLTLVDEAEMPVLLLMQTGEDLVVASRYETEDGERRYNDFLFRQALRGRSLRHLTFSSGVPDPRAHMNGTALPLGAGSGVPLAPPGVPMQGRLLLGCAPRASGSWQGVIRALVVHARAPSEAEIQARDADPAVVVERLASASGVVSAYSFCEGEGVVVEDHARGGAALHLPEYYRPIETPRFDSVKPASFLRRSVMADIAVNLIGFMPLGFFLALWFSSRGRRHPAVVLLVVVAACAAISFAIEWVQVLMPTRHSSMLDLLLNTLGAALGVGTAFRVRARRREARNADAAGSAAA